MARDVELDIIANDKTATGTASARRNLDKVDDGVKKLGKSSDDTDRSITRLAQGAQRSSSMMTTLGAKLLGAGGAVVGLVAFKVAADALAGSVLLGLGAALTAVAIKAQSMTVGVQNAFASLKEHVVSSSVTMSAAFGPALVKIAQLAKSTFDGLVPDLTIAFRKMAPAVQRFAADLGKALLELRPAIQPLADGFVRLLGATGPALQNAMRSVASGLTAIGDEINRRPEAFANFIETMGKLGEATLKTGAFFNDFGNKFRLNLDLIGVDGSRRMAELAGNTEGAAKAFEREKEIIAQLNPPLTTATQSMATLSDGERVLAEQAKDAADQLRKQSQAALANSEASIAMEQAIDDAAKAIHKGKNALDLNTQAGRDNQRALNNVASTTLAVRDASIAAGDASSVTAGKIRHGRQAWIDMSVQLGVNRRKAEEMADALFAIPPTRKTKVTADTAGASAAVESFQRRIDNLHGKTVSVTVVTRGSTGTTGKKVMAKGGIIDEPVMGVGARTGREYLIGEAGPEAVVPLSGGRGANPAPSAAGFGGGFTFAPVLPHFLGSQTDLVRTLTDAARTGQLAVVFRAAGLAV